MSALAINGPQSWTIASSGTSGFFVKKVGGNRAIRRRHGLRPSVVPTSSNALIRSVIVGTPDIAEPGEKNVSVLFVKSIKVGAREIDFKYPLDIRIHESAPNHWIARNDIFGIDLSADSRNELEELVDIILRMNWVDFAEGRPETLAEDAKAIRDILLYYKG